MFLSSNFRDFLEANFLFDCYSTNFDYPNACYPVYLIYEDFDVPARMVSKLLTGDTETINCINKVFSINDVNDFLELVEKRLTKVANWGSLRFHSNEYYLKPVIEKIKKL